MTNHEDGRGDSESDTVIGAVDCPANRGNAVLKPQIVLLVHGIRTEAHWGPMVRSKLEVPGQIVVIPILYGYFDVFRFWFPFWTRSRPIERVFDQIRVALQRYPRLYPDAKLSIVAHSFGTYIIGEILKREFDIRIHRMILCGSLLPRDFPWEQYQERFDDGPVDESGKPEIRPVVNECGRADIWPVLAQAASWGYGASGTHGFGSAFIRDRYHAAGHGQYFEPEFAERYWAPFLRQGRYVPTEFELTMRPAPGWISILGLLPLRWLLVVILLLGILTATLSLSRIMAIAVAQRPEVPPAECEAYVSDGSMGVRVRWLWAETRGHHLHIQLFSCGAEARRFLDKDLGLSVPGRKNILVPLPDPSFPRPWCFRLIVVDSKDNPLAVGKSASIPLHE